LNGSWISADPIRHLGYSTKNRFPRRLHRMTVVRPAPPSDPDGIFVRRRPT
tara:strand:+ start:1302 stop:1454 length:153 start_codon:yes stop_codon:yes gene_type:complete